MRAASIAVLPPPTMPTTRPSDGARPCSTRSISVTASMILPPSMAGISRWFATCAPMAEKHRVERACRLLGQHVGHARVADDRHAHRLDARDLLVEPFARQAVGGNAVVHHAAGLGVGVADLDLVPEAAQVIGARQARGTGADHEHALAGRRPRRDRPAFLVGEIAEKPIERMDRDGLIEELPVAGAFAGVIARAAVRARQRVLLHVLPPGPLVVARLREGEPRLDVFAGRTGVITRRQVIDVDRALPAARARALADRFLVDGRQILRNQAHGCLHLGQCPRAMTAVQFFERDSKDKRSSQARSQPSWRARQDGKSRTAELLPPIYRSRGARLYKSSPRTPSLANGNLGWSS